MITRTPDEPEREMPTDDIVARLRHAAKIAWEEDSLDFDPGLNEAADTIERLRISLHAAEKRAEDVERELDQARSVVDRLGREAEAMAELWEKAVAEDEAAAVLVLSERDSAREALGKVVEALKPFAGCVFNDNGDMTVTLSNAQSEHFIQAYFALRSALKDAGK